ncbi:SDR family NAD(P)-dependent oxidoreductase (plasmid) [Agrobacterium tumefaciens]|uniref:Short-chain dehydrogenase n=3 Tax=Rhizobiaceae TaxID=82115 RepID=A0A2Z2PFU5_AGRTU|nr:MULTISPECIES: SDR family NAD(P)-dependent oxidoreductase [Rhizobium/Agrobacterium group]ASK41010.1 short-chain dehydrogenase [Rhizobium rhizogenes]ASK41180.1 short-chain dehydrogenase [Agrobacterium tumefaciens]NTI46524.1 SDR family NAD(P)-dependent oxidoreductase [Rhizobium rhizogenes]NTI66025.1 SDR family NAD(P)-dependent oxidoreductase [Rhizobium rhizogenes]UXR95326.1 SDR family NAD(P)-dependent oxidoreductase [Agrobacterium tumefaciens]
MQPINSRVVMISGAARGIGLAIARELAEHGFRLSLGARDIKMLEAHFGLQSDQVHYAHYDAYDPASAESWVSSAVDRFGRIDALVNNAGLGEQVSLMDDNDEALDRLWAVNVKGPLRMTRLCMPHLEASLSGRIVNLASMSGKRVRNSFVGYNMTKFAVMGLTHTTRHVAWEKGVRATAICPSFVRTEMSSYTNKVSPDDMIEPDTLASLVRTAIELPNNAAMAEMLVNCRLEDTL